MKSRSNSWNGLFAALIGLTAGASVASAAPPEATFVVPEATTAPSIDGTVGASEWSDSITLDLVYPNLGVGSVSNGGEPDADPADISGSFHYTCDADYLYFGFEITDDVHIGSGYPDDHLLFGFNPSISNSVWDNTLTFEMYVDGSGNAQTAIYKDGGGTLSLASSVFAGSTDGSNWTFEAKMKWTEIMNDVGYVPATNDQFGTALLLCDNDADDGQRDVFLHSIESGSVMTTPALWHTASLFEEPAPPVDPAELVQVERHEQQYHGTATNVHTISSFETVAGENRKLVVVTARESAGADVTGITYGSQNFVQAVAPVGFRKTDIWYLDAPDVGTQDIVITYDENCRARSGVMSLQNAAQGMPELTGTVEGTVSVDVTTTVSNTLVLAVYNENNGGIAPSSTSFTDTLMNGTGGSCDVHGGWINEAVPGLKTYSWTADTNGCSIAYAGFEAAPPPPPTDVVIVERQVENFHGVSTNVHTISAFETVDAENRKLVVVTAREASGADVTGITYGSQNFVQAVAPVGFRKTDIWYLDAPDVGTQDIVITYTDPCRARSGVMNLQNAAQGLPELTGTVEGTVSVDVTTTATNTLVLAVYNENNGGILPTSTSFTSTLMFGDGGSCAVNGGWINEEVPGLKTYSWTADTNQCSIAYAGFVAPPPPPPAGVVLVDSIASHYDGDTGNATNTLSNFTVNEGRARKLVVTIGYETAATLDSITYGGQALTQAVAPGNARGSQIWYLDAPAVGTADLVAVFSGGARSLMGAMSLQNAAEGAPVVDNISEGGANTVDLTTTEANTFVVGAFTIDAGSLTNPPAFNTLYKGGSGSSQSIAGYATEPLPGTYTYTWGTDSEPAKQGAIVVAGFGVAPPLTAEELYADWSVEYGLTNGTEALTADPDFDGMNNLIEYGLGGNPTNSDAASIMPTSQVDGGVFAYVYNRRLDAEQRGLTYTVVRDTNLVIAPGWSSNGVTEAGSVVLDDEFEAVTNTVPTDVGVQFLQLQIQQD